MRPSLPVTLSSLHPPWRPPPHSSLLPPPRRPTHLWWRPLHSQPTRLCLHLRLRKCPHPSQTLTQPRAPAGLIPSMSVTLLANDLSGFAMTISAGTSLIFRAEVQNTGQVPLEVVANLAVPDGWDVDQNVFSDCPKTEDLNHNDTCTISWYFTPQGSGQVYLRVSRSWDLYGFFGQQRSHHRFPGLPHQREVKRPVQSKEQALYCWMISL